MLSSFYLVVYNGIPDASWWLGMTDELVEGHWKWFEDDSDVVFFGSVFIALFSSFKITCFVSTFHI